MTNLLERIKKSNRTLLELRTGIFLLGLVCQIPVALFCKDVAFASFSLWLGIVMAFISTESIYRSLDRALDLEEGAARKKIYISYVIRYFTLVILFMIICLLDRMYPLLVFLGYMMLKAGALIQPFTHKGFNRLLHETDPIPVTEEEAMAAREAESKEKDEGLRSDE